jgi:hypothetical protein
MRLKPGFLAGDGCSSSSSSSGSSSSLLASASGWPGSVACRVHMNKAVRRASCSRTPAALFRARAWEVAGDLRAWGQEAETVAGEGLAGAADRTVLERARTEGRVLLTLDKGIANVRVYPPEAHSGVALFRPDVSGRGTVLTFVRRYLPTLLEVDLLGRLLIITPRGVRTR